ncbi:hypothetical protein C8A03DRAFT_45177 [Achaetomium macrosporum]|uniref:Mid2 domain-containing protein n=1 Tax=Achaetomium macrosporum TaxID=79813 RepID=A0AAN7C7L7_9PEZI|nr:hypothetical protein C8A03DRAFT_45177 [Achaetomium macrosporum]
MTSVWSRLAAFTIVAVWIAVCQALRVPDCRSETGHTHHVLGDIGCHRIWTDPVPGTKALYGLQDRILDVSRRDCLANGSNYCFGNDVDYCPGCGNCCVEGKYCCGSGEISTIVVAVIERSTVLSTVEVTLSSAATQTNTIWVTATATAVARRSVASGLSNAVSNHAAPIPRQAAAPPTVTEYATRTADVTSITSVTVTTQTTSTSVTTVYQTTTRVLNAQTTVDITSTFTVTSYAPSIVTLTTTASLIPPTTPSSATPTATSSASATPEPNPSQSLSAAAIAGIAAGASVLGLLLAAIVIVSIRRRLRGRHHPPEPLPSPDAYHHPNYDDDPMFDVRQPTIPQILPHFTTTTPPHHAVQFELPASISQQQGNGNGNGYLSVRQTTQTRPGHHLRNSSGFTTLVGTPSPTSAGFGFVGGKREDQDQHQNQYQAGIAEVQGTTPENLATHGRERAEGKLEGFLL